MVGFIYFDHYNICKWKSLQFFAVTNFFPSASPHEVCELFFCIIHMIEFLFQAIQLMLYFWENLMVGPSFMLTQFHFIYLS